MSPHGPNLLIAAAIDLAGHGWPEGVADRMAASLALGKGGDVSCLAEGGNILLARASHGHAVRAIDVSEHGAQVLFAGYLQDRGDLRRQLGLSNHRPLSDAELYAMAHAHWGEDCDRHVNGHYAAILWFARDGVLRAARSPVDPSPIHWWSEGTRIILATTPRALFAAGVARRLDEAKLDTALIGSFDEPARSWFSGINRLDGGTVLTWRGGAVAMRRFWSIDDLPDVRLRRDEDYVEALDSLFRRATNEVLNGFRKPGLLLSGGLDSQAVASYMLEGTGSEQALDCFTSVPAQGFSPVERVESFPDERAHVAALAAMHPRLRVDYVEAAQHDFTHRLADLFLLGSAMPLSALNLHWIHASLTQAAAKGCDVMMSGANGNASFSYDGNTAFSGWLRQGRVLRLLRELRAVDQTRPLYRRLISWVIMPNLPGMVQRQLGKLTRPQAGQSPNWCPLAPEYLRQHRLLDHLHAQSACPDRTSRQARARLVVMASSEAGDTELALELLHGIPMRDPTAYRPLFEFCAGLPDDQFRRDGVSRWLARRLLAGRIPEAVRLESRIGQQAADWPLRLSRARPMILDELREMAAGPETAGRFDTARIIRDLESWDGCDARRSKAYENVALASSRALVASRFIRFANGSNQ